MNQWTQHTDQRPFIRSPRFAQDFLEQSTALKLYVYITNFPHVWLLSTSSSSHFFIPWYLTQYLSFTRHSNWFLTRIKFSELSKINSTQDQNLVWLNKITYQDLQMLLFKSILSISTRYFLLSHHLGFRYQNLLSPR